MGRAGRVSRGADGGARRGRKPKGPRVIWRDGVAYAYVDRDLRVTLETSDPREAAARLPEYVARAVAARRARAEEAAEDALDVIARTYLKAPHGWSKRTRATNELRALGFVEAMAARGVTRVAAITDAVLDAWRKGRMATASRATINRDEDVPRAMLRWARRHNPPLCATNPLEGRAPLREPRRRPPPLIPSPAEVGRVVGALDAAGERGAALTLATALATGLRLDELRHLPAARIVGDALHLAPEEGTADEAWQSKSYKERVVPLAPNAVRVAREFVAWRTDGRGGRKKRIGIAGTWIADKIDAGRLLHARAVDPGCVEGGKVDWDRVDAAAPRWRMHDLRRTFATECVRAGVPITTVREWMGHRDVATTERYLGRYREDAARVAPTPAALDVLSRTPASVVPITTKKGR